MATLPSNEFKELLFNKGIDFSSDVFNGILMQSGFVFNRATHNVYANVLGNELPTASGYTVGGVVLAGVTVTRNDVNNTITVTWNNPSWLAVGGDIVSQGMIIFDDTVAAPVTDPIIGYIDFGSALTTFDTGNFTISNVSVVI